MIFRQSDARTCARPGRKGYGPRLRVRLTAFLIFILTLVVFGPVRHFAFSGYDDRSYIEENPRVRLGLTPSNVGWAFTTFYQANWHPVTWVSHMVDVELYGLDPGGHHGTNAVLHAANAALLFLLFAAMTGSVLRSTVLAALFAAHPLHVESVAWVTERKDLLSTFFLILTLWSYLLHQRRRRWRTYVLTLTLYGLGLLSKPMLVTLPFVMLLLDYWPLGRLGPPFATVTAPSDVRAVKRSLLPLLREKAPLFLLAAGSSVVTYLAQRQGGTVLTMDMIPFTQRLSNAVVAYATYLAKTAWPANLAVFYPHPRGDLGFGKVLAGGMAVAALSFIAARLRRRLPFTLVGWLWFVGTLVPVIGLVQVGDQAMADRYTYVPLIGVFLIVVWSLFARAGGPGGWRLVAPPIAAALVLACAITARGQLAHWRDGMTLFRHALAVTADNWVAHDGLGYILAGQGRLEEAVVEYRSTLRIRPGFAEGHNNLGTVLLSLGRRREAMDAFRTALSLKSNLAPAHNNLGLALDKEGRRREALAHYRRAVEAAPCAANALTNLGNALDDLGMGAEAEQRYRQAIRCEPDYPGAYYNLGVLQVNQGRVGEAARNLAATLTLQPDYREASALLEKIGQTPR